MSPTPIRSHPPFATIRDVWGSLDIAVINAGVAHVSSLKDMDLAAFQRLEKINVEGTLLVLRELAKHFEDQQTGGDIVLVSTKNVFSPGATFGAYSATKAASHQLARIASLEFAAMDVRVEHGRPRRGVLRWRAQVGTMAGSRPGRMKARGLGRKRSRGILPEPQPPEGKGHGGPRC